MTRLSGMFLALFNMGPSEILLLLLLLVVLFGADRLPQMARSLGQAKARLERTKDQFSRAVEDEEAKMLREQLEFERLREQQVASAGPTAYAAEPTPEELERLREAALALGIEAEGRTPEQLRAAIARAVNPEGQG